MCGGIALSNCVMKAFTRTSDSACNATVVAAANWAQSTTAVVNVGTLIVAGFGDTYEMKIVGDTYALGHVYP